MGGEVARCPTTTDRWRQLLLEKPWTSGQHNRRPVESCFVLFCPVSLHATITDSSVCWLIVSHKLLTLLHYQAKADKLHYRVKLLHYRAESVLHYQVTFLHCQVAITFSGVFITLSGGYFINKRLLIAFHDLWRRRLICNTASIPSN